MSNFFHNKIENTIFDALQPIDLLWPVTNKEQIGFKCIFMFHICYTVYVNKTILSDYLTFILLQASEANCIWKEFFDPVF